VKPVADLATLFACCLWGAIAGWAVALAAARPEPVPSLAAWTAVLIAAAVFGVLCGLVRTRGAAPGTGA
jgi:hypothetical protein